MNCASLQTCGSLSEHAIMHFSERALCSSAVGLVIQWADWIGQNNFPHLKETFDLMFRKTAFISPHGIVHISYARSTRRLQITRVSFSLTVFVWKTKEKVFVALDKMHFCPLFYSVHTSKTHLMLSLNVNSYCRGYSKTFVCVIHTSPAFLSRTVKEWRIIP